MSHRAIELESRVRQAALERLARRPKLLADYSRRRWGRWVEGVGTGVLCVLLPVPVIAVPIMVGQANWFVNWQLKPGLHWLAPTMMFVALFLAASWRQQSRRMPEWNLAALFPIAERSLAGTWLWRMFGFAMVFAVPLSVFHATVLSGVGHPWWIAALWGLIAAVGQPLCVVSSVALLARWCGGFFQSPLRTCWPAALTVVAALTSANPQWVPRVGWQLETHNWLWWPTGWPWLLFESAAQGQHALAAGLLAAIGLYALAGLESVFALLRRCDICEFTLDESGLLEPLFQRESIWGAAPTLVPPVRGSLGRVLDEAPQPIEVPDLLSLSLAASDQPLSAEAARKEVLSGEFWQPWPDERLGWFERLLLATFVRRERQVADCLMLDGDYWSHLLLGWSVVFWAAVASVWGTQQLFQFVLGAWIWKILLLGSVPLSVIALLLTIITMFQGWPGLIWNNSQSRALPLSAYLPISHRELQLLRVRVILLKLLMLSVIAAPLFLLLSLVVGNGGVLWPVATFIGKLFACVLVFQSWWFLTWQPQCPSYFRKVCFYGGGIFLLVVNLGLTVTLIYGGTDAAWAAPAMVCVAKLTSFLFDRALDGPTIELLGCTVTPQSRSFVLDTRPPK